MKVLLIFFLSLSLTTQEMSMSANSVRADELVLLSPDGEAVVSPDQEFFAACMTMLGERAKVWTFGNPLYTVSDRWGQLLRLDFRTPDEEGNLVNRVVCWRRPADMKLNIQIAFGQRVSPLKET